MPETKGLYKPFEGKIKKNFFKDEAERNLWVRLNAEHIRYFHKVVNHKDEEDLGAIDKPYSHLWVSNNQLTYDEYMRDAPRYSFEELIGLNEADMLRLSRKRNQEEIKKMFGDL